MKNLFASAVALAVMAVSANAAPYSWANWTSFSAGTATGTIATAGGPVNVLASGNLTGIDGSSNNWNPSSSYADGSIVSNAPVAGDNMLRIDGTGLVTLTFDRPVSDLAFSVWSLGQPNDQVQYTFDQSLGIIAGGPNTPYGGSSIYATGANSFAGQEGNGTALFRETFTSLSFVVDRPESYHNFTLGLPEATPEPASLAVVGLGVAALLRRKKKLA